MDNVGQQACETSLVSRKQHGPGSGRARVKSGCRTCKIRRVKCDEWRPACHRCVSTGRVCDGYGIWGGGGNAYGSRERRQTPHAAKPQQMHTNLHQYLLWRKDPTAILGMGPQEQTALDFFRTRTAYKLPGVFSSDFWESIVFQASFAEPAVFHAVIALGAIHKNEWSIAANLRGERELRQSNESLALQHYNKAIRYLVGYGKSQDKKQSLRPVLVACVVFICLELLRRRFRTAQAHLRSGLKLVREMQSHPRRTSRTEAKRTNGEGKLVVPPHYGSVDGQLIEALTHLNIQSALFGQGAGYLQDIVPGYNPSAVHEMPRIFHTTSTARQHLDRLIDGVSFLSAQAKSHSLHHPIPEPLLHQQALLQTSLTRWLCAYTASLPTLTSTGNLKTQISLLLLRLHHTMTTIMASTSLRSTDETIFDQHTPYFTSILTQTIDLFRQSAPLIVEYAGAEAAPDSQQQQQQKRTPNLSFTLDMGYIPPLYYVGLKCRVPALRRRAIELLESMPHKEGVWDGRVAAGVARVVVEMEEGGWGHELEGVDVAEGGAVGGGIPSVPGGRRINHVSVLLPNGVGENATLVCERWTGTAWESWTRRLDVGFCKASLSIC